MKNYDAFEKLLQETDRIPAPAPGQSESGLLRLRQDLKQATEPEVRSDFHQATAWTRLEARLNEKPEPSFRWAKLFSYAATAGAAVIVTVLILSRGGDGSEAALPQISKAKQGIYATPFYSKDAQADVIWAEGYQYIPANYSY